MARCMIARDILKDGAIEHVAGGLSVFRINVDGSLTFLHKYDKEVGQERLFWMGIVAHP